MQFNFHTCNLHEVYSFGTDVCGVLEVGGVEGELKVLADELDCMLRDRERYGENYFITINLHKIYSNLLNIFYYINHLIYHILSYNPFIL